MPDSGWSEPCEASWKTQKMPRSDVWRVDVHAVFRGKLIYRSATRRTELAANRLARRWLRVLDSKKREEPHAF